jgi:hypothetical protein
MELRDALTQISEIRAQMARAEVFRGYRAVPVAFSGALALAAAAAQAVWLPRPAAAIGDYLLLWVAAALLSAVAAGSEMAWRCRSAHSSLTREVTWLAIEQFLPSVVAGGLLTAVLALSAPESVWLLPGLWSILFALGVFASCRLLPGAIFWAGAYYLAAGVLCLLCAKGSAALSPWAMAGSFGVGQFLTAGILYWTLERDHDQA